MKTIKTPKDLVQYLTKNGMELEEASKAVALMSDLAWKQVDCPRYGSINLFYLLATNGKRRAKRKVKK